MKIILIVLSMLAFSACVSDAEKIKQAETTSVPATEDCDDKAKAAVTPETIDLQKNPDQGCTLE